MSIVPETERKSKTPLGLFLLAVLMPISLCFFSFVALFIGVALTEIPYDEITTSTYDGNSESSYFSENNPRGYIDPTVDSEAAIFIQDSSNHYDLIYENNTYGGGYHRERDFILANLENNYQQQSTRLGVTYDTKYTVIITDNQRFYEEQFGFDFDYELPYAGLTSKSEMVLLIHDDLLKYKDDFNKLISHEIVHTMQFQTMTGDIITYPTWFSEGTAEYFGGTPLFPFEYYESSETLTDIQRLDDSYYSGDSDLTFAGYNMSNHFVYYLAFEYGDEKLINIMVPENGYSSFYVDFIDTYGISPEQMYENWFKANIADPEIVSSTAILQVVNLLPNTSNHYSEIPAVYPRNMLYNASPR